MKKISLFALSFLFIGSVFAGDLPRTELPRRIEIMKIGGIAAPQNNPQETDNEAELGIDGSGSVYIEEIVTFPPANESSDIDKETAVESLSDLKIEGVEGESRNDGEDRIEETMVINKVDLKLEGIDGESRDDGEDRIEESMVKSDIFLKLEGIDGESRIQVAPTEKDVYRVDLSLEKEKIESDEKSITGFVCDDGSVVVNASDCLSNEIATIKNIENIIKNDAKGDDEGGVNGGDTDFYRIEGHQGKAQDHNGSRSNTTASESIELPDDLETDSKLILGNGGGAGKVNVQDLSLILNVLDNACNGIDNDCDGIVIEDEMKMVLKKTWPAFEIDENSEMEVKKADGKKIVEISGTEKASLFGLFEMDLDVEIQIDETGEVVEIEKPWYSVFSW